MLASKNNQSAKKSAYKKDESLYVRNYKPTDIFFSNQQESGPKKRVTDRNRSSVFDTEQAVGKRGVNVNRMASNVFGNEFEQHQTPDQSRSSSGHHNDSIMDSRDSQDLSRQAESIDDAIRVQNDEIARLEREYHQGAYRNDEDEGEEEKSRLYYAEEERNRGEEVEYSDRPLAKDDYQREEVLRSQYAPTNRKSISSVFEAENHGVYQGSRRHFQSREGSGIFDGPATPDPQRFEQRRNEKREWTPCVKQYEKSTSFSNLFGDSSTTVRQSTGRSSISGNQCDSHSRASDSGSQDLNRGRGGKGRRGGSEIDSHTRSQIWF